MSTLLSGLLGYCAKDQFVASPPQSAAAAANGAGRQGLPEGAEEGSVQLEPWLSSRFEELPPSVPAPTWHVPSDKEVPPSLLSFELKHGHVARIHIAQPAQHPHKSVRYCAVRLMGRLRSA